MVLYRVLSPNLLAVYLVKLLQNWLCLILAAMLAITSLEHCVMLIQKNITLLAPSSLAALIKISPSISVQTLCY